MNINQIITGTADSALKIQSDDGSFPPGQNGPWNKRDTPVRVTAHWSILLLKAYQISKKTKYKKSALKALDYLTQKTCRPYGYSFHCINSKSDYTQVNGLIGQAWTIEALIEAYNHTKNKRYISIAEEVIMHHSFDKNLCLWHVLSLDGKNLGIHKSLNQQVWFSVMAYKVALIMNNEDIKKNMATFFRKFPKFIKYNKCIGMKINEFSLLSIFNPKSLISLKSLIKTNLTDKSLELRSRGYLAFLICGLAMLYETDPKICFKNPRTKEMIRKSIAFLDDEVFKDDDNKYGFPYNPIGIEVAYIKEIFSSEIEYKDKISISRWLKKQLGNHFDYKNMLMNKNTMDNKTLSARIYEITKIKNRKIQL